MSGGRTHPHEGAVFQQRADKAFVHPFSSPWVEYGDTLSTRAHLRYASVMFQPFTVRPGCIPPRIEHDRNQHYFGCRRAFVWTSGHAGDTATGDMKGVIAPQNMYNISRIVRGW